MTIRKRRQPTAGFNLPPPYQPITGGRAELMVHGVFPYCAMMQIAAEDTHLNYVICRGCDIRINRFIDYEEGNVNKPGIPVAKPFNKRRKGAYRIAHIFPAVLPLQGTHPTRPGEEGSHSPSPADVPWRVGQNPGVCETSEGQPADLDETVEAMQTDEGVYINWMLLDVGAGGNSIECCFKDAHPGRGEVFEVYKNVGWDPDDHRYLYDTSDEDTISKAIDWWCDSDPDLPGAGARAYFHEEPSTEYGTIMVLDGNCDCDSPGSCDDEGTECGELA